MAGARARAGTTAADFTPEEIAKAALEIMASEGPEAVSFRRIGDALGTNHVMIFRRCGSFDGLLNLCADFVAADFPEIDETLDWQAATQLRFEAAFDMWTTQADLILLMGGRAWLGENMLSRFYEPGMRALVDSGMSPLEAGRLFSTLYRMTIGSAISTRPDQWTPWASKENIERLGSQRFPTLARVEREIDTSDMRAVYYQTLQRLITHLAPGEQKTRVSDGPTAEALLNKSLIRACPPGRPI
ncbi:MAG TPA: hypothetical protein VMF07_15600 [Solirubrobacteraceae bacterium]|nr:hypothetical protein [Solirubrobacteraceae bacterium]